MKLHPLEQSIALAAQAHDGELDKFGEPYILHVLRVVGLVPPGEAKIVAALHDAVEHTDLAIPDDFSPAVRAALNAICRGSGADGKKESWKDYIDRVSKNRLAALTNLADVRDRMAHLAYAPDDQQAKYAPRYRYAMKILEPLVRGDVPDLAAGASLLEGYSQAGVHGPDQ